MLSRLEELIEGLRERSAEWRQMLPRLACASCRPGPIRKSSDFASA